jgi:hypothetical protein
MDFSRRVDELQQRVAATKATVQDAATESREQLRQRIDQAQQDAKDAQQRAQQRADQTTDRARSKFAQMKADAAAKMDDLQAKIDRRTRQLDAKAAATATARPASIAGAGRRCSRCRNVTPRSRRNMLGHLPDVVLPCRWGNA